MGAPEREISFAEASLDDVVIPLDDEVPFGRYQLCYEIGSGGMATVFLARTAGPGRFTKAVALKRIHPHLVKRKDFVAMFLDEARIASLISHPNVCSAFDFGEIDGTYYMAMEYLVGEPLSHVLRNLAQRPSLVATERWMLLAARIAADVAEGLHAAHELKDENGVPMAIVHRDVSPQNVFVTYDGAVKLVDFGVAFANDRLTETVAGTIKGKLAYLAPEQLTARGSIDRRVDVWALGVTLWEMLTCKRLFARRSDGATLVAIQSQEPPLVSSVMPGVPPELDAIVARALAHDPAERYATARAVGRDLSAFVAHTGRSVGLADISELMGELFTSRRPEKLEALSVVMEPTGIRRRRATRTLEGAPPAYVQSAATSLLDPGVPSATHAAPTRVLGPAQSEIVTSVSEPTLAPDAALAVQRRRSWMAVAAACVVVGLLGVGGLVWAGTRGSTPPAPPVHLPGPPVGQPGVPLQALPSSPPVVAAPPSPVIAPVYWTQVPDPRPPPDVAPDVPVDDTPTPRGGGRPVSWGQARFVCGVWADVREHGQRLGRTPAAIRLRAGRHTVEFVGSDGRRTTRAFELPANGSAVVRCER